MKYPEELNLQKEMDCGTGAERARHTRARREEGREGRMGAQIAFCRLQTKSFLGSPGTDSPKSLSLAMVAISYIG